MPTDYRRPTPPPTPTSRRRSSRRGTCAFWFLFGGLLGAFGVGYAWMTHVPTASGPGSEQATTRAPASPPQERTFDFYSLLPEEEVLLPDQEDAEPPRPPVPQQPAETATTPPAPSAGPSTTPGAAPSSGRSTYLLQLGSFRNSADAERLRAQLALKGIQTSIQTVTIDNGQVYHRVRTAHYEQSEAQAMRAKLNNEGQESIMIRAR